MFKQTKKRVCFFYKETDEEGCYTLFLFVNNLPLTLQIRLDMRLLER